MNKKLEKNKRIFNEYLDKKNHILKCEKEKYNWYLNLEEIIFDYLGVNRCTYLTVKNFRNFPVCLCQSSYNCTEEDAKNLINEVADFLDKVEIEYEELGKILNLDSYEKSLIYKKRYFNLEPEKDIFNNIKLVSITISEEDSRIYYEVPKTESYDMTKYINEEEHYFKKAIGTFMKEDITFNINKNYIDKISILENKVEKEYSVKEFEKKYGPVNTFIYKELSDLVIDNDEPIVQKAIELISNFVNLRTLTEIYFRENISFVGRERNIGLYAFGSIYITTKPTYTLKLETLIHEIGHYIHDKYFKNKQFRFSTKYKTRYAKKNYLENFAECFTDLIYYRKDNERTRKMIKILSEII